MWEAAGLHASFYENPADPNHLVGDLGLATKCNMAFGKLSGGQKQRRVP